MLPPRSPRSTLAVPCNRIGTKTACSWIVTFALADICELKLDRRQARIAVRARREVLGFARK